MKLYTWADYCEGDTSNHYRSLREARAELKEHLRVGGDAVGVMTHGSTMLPIAIERIDVGPLNLRLLLNVLNDRGYVYARETVETWRAVACGKCDYCDEETPADCQKKRVRRE